MKTTVKALTATIAALSPLLMSTSAVSGTLFEMDSQTFTTAVSGTDRTIEQIVGTSKDFKAINRVTNWEHSDDPCGIKVKMRHLNNYTATTSSGELRANCDNDKITVGYSDNDTYVRGIQVCHSSSNRIKGLRVWGSKINRTTGALIDVNKVEDKRPNCKHWQAKRYCPAGEIATKLIIETTGYAYTGAALVCREVKIQ